MREIIFEVVSDEIDGGFVASALGHGIFTQADCIEELRANVKNAVHCHFQDDLGYLGPQFIRLRFIQEEVLAV